MVSKVQRNRSNMLQRRLASSSLALLAIVLLTGNVFASGWCRADPIVEINGEEVQIWVAIPAEYQALVNGPIEVSIRTPNNTDTRVTYLDAGFNGHGEKVTFVKQRDRGGASFYATIDVRVPMAVQGPGWVRMISGVPVEVEIVHAGESQRHYGDHYGTRAIVEIGAD